MKKYVLLFILLLTPLIAKAELEIDFVDHYEGNIGYSESGIIKDTWAYDPKTEKYVKFDQNGNKLYEIANPNDDPRAKKGKVNIKATVPDNLKDETIVVNILSVPYEYSFELNKNNNFNVIEDVNEANYSFIEVYVKDHEGEYSIFYPGSINVYDGKTTNLDLDYSDYKEDISTKKDKTKETIILVVFGVIVITFFIIVVAMFMKAKNI